MLLKYLGAALILISSPGLGMYLAGQWKERLRLLEKLRQMIYFLKGEITYSHAPLAEALERVGRRGGGPLGDMFVRASERICTQEGESLQEIWSGETRTMAAGAKNLPLTRADLEQFNALGEHLGYLDVDMQERTLLLYLEQLDLSIEYLQAHRQEKCRLYTSLGVMGGIFLVIVMC